MDDNSKPEKNLVVRKFWTYAQNVAHIEGHGTEAIHKTVSSC